MYQRDIGVAPGTGGSVGEDRSKGVEYPRGQYKELFPEDDE